MRGSLLAGARPLRRSCLSRTDRTARLPSGSHAARARVADSADDLLCPLISVLREGFGGAEQRGPSRNGSAAVDHEFFRLAPDRRRVLSRILSSEREQARPKARPDVQARDVLLNATSSAPSPGKRGWPDFGRVALSRFRRGQPVDVLGKDGQAIRRIAFVAVRAAFGSLGVARALRRQLDTRLGRFASSEAGQLCQVPGCLPAPHWFQLRVVAARGRSLAGQGYAGASSEVLATPCLAAITQPAPVSGLPPRLRVGVLARARQVW